MDGDYPRIERPTEPGAYWFRQIGWSDWKIEHAFRSEVDGRILVDVPSHVRCEWAGPIPKPSRKPEPPALTPLASGPPQRRRRTARLRQRMDEQAAETKEGA